MAIKINIGEVKKLLDEGKKVKVKTIGNKFVNVSNFIDKGLLETYCVFLDNDLSIKVSKKHKFFSNCGWVETDKLVPNETKLLCEDGLFHIVEKIEFVGKKKIVDITVDFDEHCYYGNGILNHNTGKSLIAYHILANTQKKGGVAVYIDTERAANKSFMERMGVNWDKLIYERKLSCIEEVFDYIEKVISVARMKIPDKHKPIVIVWDSVAATPPKTMLEAAYEDNQMGVAARAMSKCLAKVLEALDEGRVTLVCINQMRQKIGVMFGDPDIAPHGKALPFYASVRIKMSGTKKIADKATNRTIGVAASAKVFKNKVAPNHREACFPIFFDWGVQDDQSILDWCCDTGIVANTGAWKVLVVNGEEHKFQTPDWKDLYKKEEIRLFINEQFKNKMIIPFSRDVETVQLDCDSILEMEQLQDDLGGVK